MGLAVLGCLERIESSYATLGEAKRDGAIERGWIPGFLPPSAREIHEVHDLDTNSTRGSCLFDRSDLSVLRSALVELDREELAGVEIPPPRGVRWWPRGLRGSLEHDAFPGWIMLRDPGGEWVVAVETQRPRALFWRVRW